MRRILFYIFLFSSIISDAQYQQLTWFPGNNIIEKEKGDYGSYVDPVDDFKTYKKIGPYLYKNKYDSLFTICTGSQDMDTLRPHYVQYFKSIGEVIELSTYKTISGEYFQTKGKVYYWEKGNSENIPIEIIRADPKTFTPFSNSKILGGTDATLVFFKSGYHEFKILEGANPKKIKAIKPIKGCPHRRWYPYFSDGVNVYYGSKKVEGADPNSFHIICEKPADAMDKNHNYSHGNIFYNIRKNIVIDWKDSIEGDFSFTENWSFPMGIGTKDDGRAGCGDGGFCSPQCYAMLDSNGIVFKDSTEAYYKLIDTTHLYHTISCDAWCYEWAGTDFMIVEKDSGDKYNAYTLCGIATHCSLHLSINTDSCFPLIDLLSIVSGGDAIYYCTDGYIKIDKNLWNQGIMKAEFSFNFEHAERPETPIFWKGSVYSKIGSKNDRR